MFEKKKKTIHGHQKKIQHCVSTGLSWNFLRIQHHKLKLASLSKLVKGTSIQKKTRIYTRVDKGWLPSTLTTYKIKHLVFF